MVSYPIELIDRLYMAFDRPVPDAVLGCPCCSDPIALRRLVEIPLRQLTAADLNAYAADALLTVGDDDDLRYFWPRLVELSLRDELDTAREVVFDKPRLAEWRTRWTAAQQQVTLEVADVVIRSLSAAETDPEELDGWVCAIGRFVDDITSHLDPMLAPRSRPILRAWYDLNEPRVRRDGLWNEYWGHHPNAERLREWFMSPAVLDAIARAPSEHSYRSRWTP